MTDLNKIRAAQVHAAEQAAIADLPQRLRALVRGFHEWRVENPQDGSYCMSMTRDDSVNPEEDCRDWLEIVKRASGQFADYIVKHHHVLTEKDKALAEAADALGALQVDAARYRLVRRGQHWSVINGIGDTLSGDALDAAADAKLAAPRPESMRCAGCDLINGCPEFCRCTPAIPAPEGAPAGWPSGIDIADEIDSLLPASMGYSTRAAVEQWWRDLVARKLSKLAAPSPAEGDERAAAQSAPEGFRLVLVNEAFDDLMYWLDRCESKGHLENCADLIEPWSRFDYRAAPTPSQAEPDVQPKGTPAGYALIHEDALRAWGKLDEVRAACVYPVAAPSVPSPAVALSKRGEQFEYDASDEHETSPSELQRLASKLEQRSGVIGDGRAEAAIHMRRAAAMLAAAENSVSVYMAERNQARDRVRQLRSELDAHAPVMTAAAEAIESLLSLIRRNAPELSGKVIGWAERDLAALRAVVGEAKPPVQPTGGA